MRYGCGTYGSCPYGVGIATVIANGVSGSFVCCFLMQEKGSMHLSVKAMQLDKKYLKEVLENARRLRKFDDERMAKMRQTTDPFELADIMKGIYK